MGKSKHGPAHKIKKKKANIQKIKTKQMENFQEAKAKEQPVTFTYDENAQTVAIPMKAWQTLNHCAMKLQEIGLFVSTMELVGQQHMSDGTLLPVYNSDLEPTGVTLPSGEAQKRIKPEFWQKRAKEKNVIVEKPTIITVDGQTIYDASSKEAQVAA